jgi:hypothetical protein
MTCFHAEFRIPGSIGLLVITINLKAKDTFCMVAMLFHVLQKNHLNRSLVFCEALLFIISGTYIKQCYFCSHLKSLHDHNVNMVNMVINAL